MHTIRFEISPSEDSNDHQVRIMIDHSDFLGGDYLGIDPPRFFAQGNLFEAGDLLIGRCTCGCEGCGDYPVFVSVNSNTITWSNLSGLKLEFDRAEYNKAIQTAKNDQSWEDKNRRVERVVSDLLRQTTTKDGYGFDWASARIKENCIMLSYSKNRDQKVFEIEWDGASAASGVIHAEKLLGTHVFPA